MDTVSESSRAFSPLSKTDQKYLQKFTKMIGSTITLEPETAKEPTSELLVTPKKVYWHVCRFPRLIERNIKRPAPYESYFLKLKYRLKRYLIVSRKHPQRRFFFRSEFTLFAERKRQLSNRAYRFSIHPFSIFSLYYDFFMSIMLAICFFFTPLHDTFLTPLLSTDEDEDWMAFVRLSYSLVMTISIIVNFQMGYVIEDTKEIVLDPKKIAMRYIRSYFIFDLLATIYSYFVCLAVLLDVHIAIRVLIYPLGFLRCVRLPSLLNQFETVLSWWEVKDADIVMVKIITCTCNIVHWLTCLLYYVPVISYYNTKSVNDSYILSLCLGNDPKISIYFELLLCVVSHFFSAGKASFRQPNTQEKLLLAIISMFGCIHHIFVIALYLQSYGIQHISQVKYEKLINEMQHYISARKVSEVTRLRLLTYYDYRFQKHFFNESYILSSLSPHLCCEIKLHECRNLIDKLDILRDASKEAIGAFIGMLNQQLFLRGDKILNRNEENEWIYFIVSGTVMELMNGLEIQHLGDGNHFGEFQTVIGLSKKKPPIDVYAIETTDTFYIHYSQLISLMQNYPTIEAALLQVAAYKKNVHKMFLDKGTLERPSNDILTELKHGKILQQRLFRTTVGMRTERFVPITQIFH